MPATETLRNELLGFQKAQADLVRWKLIAVGAVATSAFGFATGGHSLRLMILAIVPLVNVYCDLLNRDYDLRIMLIASFLRRESEFRAYEEFLLEPDVAKARPWFLGNVATLLSSVVACTFVIWVGIQPQLITGNDVAEPLEMLVLAGAAGIWAALVIQLYFYRAHRRIFEAASNTGKLDASAANN